MFHFVALYIAMQREFDSILPMASIGCYICFFLWNAKMMVQFWWKLQLIFENCLNASRVWSMDFMCTCVEKVACPIRVLNLNLIIIHLCYYHITFSKCCRHFAALESFINLDMNERSRMHHTSSQAGTQHRVGDTVGDSKRYTHKILYSNENLSHKLWCCTVCKCIKKPGRLKYELGVFHLKKYGTILVWKTKFIYYTIHIHPHLVSFILCYAWMQLNIFFSSKMSIWKR